VTTWFQGAPERPWRPEWAILDASISDIPEQHHGNLGAAAKSWVTETEAWKIVNDAWEQTQPYSKFDGAYMARLFAGPYVWIDHFGPCWSQYQHTVDAGADEATLREIAAEMYRIADASEALYGRLREGLVTQWFQKEPASKGDVST
jgi:hypothetical protein